MKNLEDRFSCLPDEVIHGVLRASMLLDPTTLPADVEGIRAAYDAALSNRSSREAAEVTALPVLKRLTEQVFSGRTVTVGMDAFGRFVASALNGQEFPDDELTPWIVSELEIAGRSGSSSSGSFNKPMLERRNREMQGVSQRTGRRGRGRSDLRDPLPLHQSTRLQQALAEAPARFAETIERDRLESLVDNPREFDPRGGPVIILDANVILPGIVRKGLSECAKIVNLVCDRSIQLGMTPPMAHEVVCMARKDTLRINGPRLQVIDEGARSRLRRVIGRAVNIADGGPVPQEYDLKDGDDFPYLVAAARVAQRGLSGSLVSRDRHVLDTAGDLPEEIRVLQPGDFLRQFRSGVIPKKLEATRR